MSFRAKDLQYEKQEPAFLRRIRAGNAEADGRHNVQIARPSKSRLKLSDEDDGPVIIDEDGEVVKQADFETRQNAGLDPEAETTVNRPNGPAGADVEQDSGADKMQDSKQTQRVAGIGGGRKRKQVRVVGDDNDQSTDMPHEVRQHEPLVPSTTSNMKSINATSSTKSKSKQQSTAQKKKAKKIKLSFDDPD